VISDMMDGIGATIMGRNMFGPIRGEWAREDRDGGRDYLSVCQRRD
jgi:hypothetical protein